MKKKSKVILTGSTMLMTLYLATPVYATSFSDILGTKSFSGSWSWIDKFSFVGQFMQFIISVVCLLGLCGIVITKLASVLFLSNKPLFNEIHEIKQVGVSGGDNGWNMFGVAPMWKDVAAGKHGSGLDVVVAWFMSLSIDVYKYSDYSDTAKASTKLDAETDTVGTYIMRTFIGTVIALFVLSMGFDGTLWQGYATVVSGLSVVGDRMVNVNLERAVTRTLDGAGDNYSFSFKSSSTELGEMQQKVSNSLYYQILGRSDDLDSNFKNATGVAIEEWVANNITIENLNTYVKSTVSSVQEDEVNIVSDVDVGSIKYNIIINTSEKNLSGGKDVGITVPVSQFVGDSGGSSNYYVHLVFTKDKINSGGFFTVKEDTAS